MSSRGPKADALLDRPSEAVERSIDHAAQSQRGERLPGRPLRHTLLLLIGAVATAPIAVFGTYLVLREQPLTAVWVVAIGLALAWGLAAFASDRMATYLGDDLERITAACRGVDEGSRSDLVVLCCRDAAPVEIHALFAEFQRMLDRVDASHERLSAALQAEELLRAQLEEAIAQREDEVRERTVELQTANLDLERLAREDGLTGIANHRRFVEFAEQCWRICLRERQPVSILMIDVDHFKAFNDIYGHQAGDHCLRDVSKAIATTARRPLDLAARYGGEEFAMVLGQVDLDDAFELAEQVRRAVVNLDVPHSGSPDLGIVSISVGVATLRPRPGTEVGTLISLADKALYRAKRSGRNRVERAAGTAGR